MKYYLLEKHISKHSTGAYIDICEGVNKWLYASLSETAISYGLGKTEIGTAELEMSLDLQPVSPYTGTMVRLTEGLDTELLEWKHKYESNNIQLGEAVTELKEAHGMAQKHKGKIEELSKSLEWQKVRQEKLSKSFQNSLSMIQSLRQSTLLLVSSSEAIRHSLDNQEKNFEELVEFARHVSGQADIIN